MGVDLETWRRRVGQFYKCNVKQSDKYNHTYTKLHSDSSTKSADAATVSDTGKAQIKTWTVLVTTFILSVLLLISSGDIELNPGPQSRNILFHCIASADHHQAHNMFSLESRGRQCVPNSCCFLLSTFTSSVPNMSKDQLHSIMYGGDYLYRKIQNSLLVQHNSFHTMSYTYLLPTELPQYMVFNGVCFQYSVRKCYSGCIEKGFVGEYPIVPFETALALAISGPSDVDSHMILIFSGVAVGLSFQKTTNTWFIFDSHSRGESGLLSSEGSCVLGYCQTTADLCSHIRKLAQSLSARPLSDTQFDLHAINIKTMPLSNALKRVPFHEVIFIPCDKASNIHEIETSMSDLTSKYLQEAQWTKCGNIRKNSKCIKNEREQKCNKFSPDEACRTEIKDAKKTASPTPKPRITLCDIPFFHSNVHLGRHETLKTKHGQKSKTTNVNQACGNDEAVHTCLHKTGKAQKRNAGHGGSLNNKRRRVENTDEIVVNTLENTLRENNKELESNFISDINNGKHKDENSETIDQFHKSVSSGPVYICTLCTQTFFRHSVVSYKPDHARCSHYSPKYHVISYDGKEWICNTCLKHIRNGKVPPLSVLNGMEFPKQPEELKDLTQLEERLIAPRIPFMQVRELPRGGQLNIKGNVVNVPADVNETVRVLPRTLNDSETIPIKFKRRKEYKHHIAFERVRPNKVFAAAKWLVENSELFRNEGITISEDWSVLENLAGTDFNAQNQRGISSDNEMRCFIQSETESRNGKNEKHDQHLPKQSYIKVDEFEAYDIAIAEQTEIPIPENEQFSVDIDCSLSVNHHDNTGHVADAEDASSRNEWTEDDNFNEHQTGNLDTMMQSADFREFNTILSLAPGENSKPMGMFQDIFAEFLSFPSIYCGKTREDNNKRKVPVHYSDICKWELRNMDRRVANCIPNIFFKLKKLQIKQIQDKVSLVMRKCKMQGKKLTAGELIQPGIIANLLKLDEGYRILRQLRGSPPYWEKAKKDIFAMIRQLGLPTWFCSFSAAETKWKSLLTTLQTLSTDNRLKNMAVDEMSWQDRCKLIKMDPITCARYFEHRVHVLIHQVLLKSPNSPLGEIVDYFYRVEFQQRGSPHIHMLAWVKSAPSLDNNSMEEIVTFVDKHVTCKNDQTMPDLVNYQTHRHARTCQKKGKDICRFNFPLPPMKETCILLPLEETHPKKDFAKAEYVRVAKCLEEMGMGGSCSFDEFLHMLGMNYDVYILAIRSSISSPKVFVKRNPDEIRINNYNSVLMKCWEANLDVQFVLDPYACASYIVSYISKGQRGMSNLLYQACQEAKFKDCDIRQQVRRVGNQFLTHVEIGAQEAAYILLQMPLRRSSRSVVFVDTNTTEERVVLIKPMTTLQDMAKNSTNIESDNCLKRYIRRPMILNNYCFADFVSWFDIIKSENPNKKKNVLNSDTELPELEYEDNADDVPDVLNEERVDSVECTIGNDNGPCNQDSEKTDVFHFHDGTIIRKRKVQKVLRYCKFNKEHDRENYFRELLMLFTSWRNESVDFLGTFNTYEERYNYIKDHVDAKQKQYVKSNKVFEAVQEIQENSLENDEMDVCNEVAQQVQHQEELDVIEGRKEDPLFGCFNPGLVDSSCSYDLGDDFGISRKQVGDDDKLPDEIDNQSFCEMICALNFKQKEIFYHILHLSKTSVDPFYTFLSGGAGVGKSVLVKAIFQALIKFYGHIFGECPDDKKVMLCAPTGKAAHNIGGNTIHSVFCIPVGRGLQYKPLDMQQLTSLQTKYHALKVLIIDEISMVGKRMFNFINLRLQEILGVMKPFGGISVLAVGDLFQLRPVKDSWIFANGADAHGLGNIACNIWVDHFNMFELTEIMRQKDDLMFAELLNRLREGNQSEDDINCLKTCIISSDHSNNSISTLPHLYTRRCEVAEYNNLMFQAVPAQNKTIVSAIDTVTGDMSADMQQKIISKIPDDSCLTMGLDKFLHLAENVPAEICLNINVEDGLTNGTPCLIKKLDFRIENSDRCSIVWVQFDDPSIGRQARLQYRHLYKREILHTWTPVLELTRKFSFQYFKAYSITRRQFPIHLAAAKTIHKAQGSTLSGAVIHFGTRRNDHMHYVGLSRVTNMENLHISHLAEEKISVSDQALEEMGRLRTDAKLVPCLPSFSCKEGFKILYHNCRSLKRHFGDVCRDNNMQYCDILAFSETRLTSSITDVSSETYNINNFQKFESKNDFHQSQRTPSGLIVYASKAIEHTASGMFSDIEYMLMLSQNCVENPVYLCFIYCPPKFSTVQRYKVFFEYLNARYLQQNGNSKLICMGDFNLDLMKHNYHSLKNELLIKYGCRQLIQTYTTDYKTCLDHIYTNMDSSCIDSSGTLESYFSDHKPIFIILK